ncbi:MAG TPA: SRPBCC domain-containing protein, partial [Polyangiaceae bacterium]
MNTGKAPSGDGAAVSVRVAVSREDAFDVFTREIDLWWRHGQKFRIAGRRRGTLHLEPGVGGRLFETFEQSTGSRTIEVGRMTGWDPPGRLAFEWQGVNFKPHEKTFVEVLFEPSGEGTLVTVRH